MKKLLYTLLAVSIIFSACEEEDKTSSNNINFLIQGSWESSTQTFISDTSTYVFTLEDAVSVGLNPIKSFEFVSNGILYDTHINGDIDTNEWFFVADSLHIVYNGGGLEFVGKCIVTTTNLTLTGPDVMTNLSFFYGVHTVIMNAIRE